MIAYQAALSICHAAGTGLLGKNKRCLRIAMLVGPRKVSRMPSSNGLLGSLGRHAENPVRNDGRRSTGQTRNASTPRILMQLAREN